MASRLVAYVVACTVPCTSQMSGLDVAGLLNRLVDRQHDDFKQAVQREQSVRAEAKAEAAHREQQLKAGAEQREERAYQREKRSQGRGQSYGEG